MTSTPSSSTVAHRSEPAQPEPHDPALEQAIASAVARIAPAWPLDRWAAVNPMWGFIDMPIEEASAALTASSGSRLLMPREWYRQAWASGRLRDEHLRAAIQERGEDLSIAALEARLEREAPDTPRRALITDLVDEKRDLFHHMSWRDFIVDSLSQVCASYFDGAGQAQLGSAGGDGLYATWLQHARLDRGPKLLMELREYTDIVRHLPSSPRAMIAQALADLEVDAAGSAFYLTALLLDLHGWASHCAYRRWTARAIGQDDDHIVELLAMRIAWEWMLHRAGGRPLGLRWQMAMAGWKAAGWKKIDRTAAQSQRVDWLLQRALEIAYQQELCRQLTREIPARAAARPSAQVAFCIDVRSEVFRRALETQADDVQTLGFAGFFGIPIEYLPVAAHEATPRLPGLLAPSLRATDAGVDTDLSRRRAERTRFAAAWKAFRTTGISKFAFVESMGLFYAVKLLAHGFGMARPVTPSDRAGLSADEHGMRKPRLTEAVDGTPLETSARIDLAENILRAMSLTHGFARLVVLMGHGSETANNPYAAGLDCGACCGHSGDVNARVVAALLNDASVREGLRERGIEVPRDTHVLPGLHNTTTDETTLFDLDELPTTHERDLQQLRSWLDAAGARTRRERARALGLEGLNDAALKKAVVARARDWSEVRPEWGLAHNAAFVVARRERTRHLNLAGRAFLHDYRHEDDEGLRVLELIMTAPMVVTHWINFQYYASTVDHARFGSGNKVLHNVVGGRLGVFEGNGGDLRIGLPLQCLHDGEDWVHTPLRLSVFIEAPRSAIEAVLAKHAVPRQLVEHGWIHLFQIESEDHGVHAFRKGRWVPSEGALQATSAPRQEGETR